MSAFTASNLLLEVSDLVVDFKTARGRPRFRALDEISLDVAEHETVGVVGESGSGKTTLGRAVLGLIHPSCGSITFAGSDITNVSDGERRKISSELRVVFQDPYSSLNPSRTVEQTLAEGLALRSPGGGAEARRQVQTMLERVGLSASDAFRYPGSFSGGQRQRVAIARALMTRPRLVICDEPVSALDLSVQAQVLNLLQDLQAELRVSYLFIAHDLTVVRHISHRIVVLYRGQVMEHGDATTVYAHPMHPYTQALLDAAPVPDPVEQAKRRKARRARPLPPHGTTDGCAFATRCLYAVELCRTARPIQESTPKGVMVACHRWREIPQLPGPDPRQAELAPL